jgi:hypothetical protein
MLMVEGNTKWIKNRSMHMEYYKLCTWNNNENGIIFLADGATNRASLIGIRSLAYSGVLIITSTTVKWCVHI